MKIAFYCPNKPLDHPNPSGDLAIARSIRDSLVLAGHDCREVVAFRARWFWSSPGGWLRALKALFRAGAACCRFRPDLWLTYHVYYKSPDVIGPVLARIFDVPYVLFQPMFGTRRGKDPKTRRGYHLNRMALGACTHAFTNNLNDLEALRRILPDEKLTHLTPGIFPEHFMRVETARDQVRRRYRIPADKHLLLSAARLRPGVKEESVRFLFDVLGELSITRDDFLLLLVGDGPVEEPLRHAAEHRLHERVIFAGGIPREAMATFYSAADLFVFPGIGESLGMVYLEAQACGTPVVALHTAGVAQVVADGQTGVLVGTGSARDMAGVVSRLLDDEPRRQAMGKAGVAFVQNERNLHLNYGELALRLTALAGKARESGGR